MKKIYRLSFLISFLIFYSCGNSSEDVKEKPGAKSNLEVKEKPEVKYYSEVKDFLGVKGPLEFNATTFDLAWSDKPRDNYYIQEYLPLGEKLENFNQMMSVHLFLTDLTVEKMVSKKIGELEDRKKSDELCNYSSFKSPDGNEIIVDFILSEDKEGQTPVIEFNAYRYKQTDIGNGSMGIIIYAYSKRSYGDGIDSFLRNLKEDRTKYLDEMSKTTIPDVTISE
ncbi:MAG: hypothetical protein WAT71_10315 [Ignavibacteria bacterium]